MAERTYWIKYGCASVAAFLAVFLIQIPAAIYAGNADEFSWPFMNILVLYAPLAAGTIITATLLLMMLPIRMARLLALMLFALTMVAWLNGTFFIYNFGLLDGHAWKIEAPAWRIICELAGSALAATFSILVLRAKSHAATGFLIAILCSAMTPLLSINFWKSQPIPADVSEYSRFSPQKNVLVILLDSMQSDVLEDVLSENPDIQQSLEGFTLFTDVAGVGMSTFMSMPAIHSGTEYVPGHSIRKWYAEGVKADSYLNRLAEAGYRSSMTNPMIKICPEKVRTCTPASWVFGGPQTGLRDEATKLANMSLLRLVPFPLKPLVYNRDKWVLSFSNFDPRTAHYVVEGNYFLRHIANSISVDSPAPTAKLFHMFSTHLPVVLDKDCNYVGEIALSRPAQVDQAKCAMREVAALLASLKNKGIYDSTTVVIHADHGSGGWRNPRSLEDRTVAGWLRAVANPALAIKPPQSRGPLTTSSKLLSISAIAPTVCHLTGDCSADLSRSAFAAESAPGQIRRFYTYGWKHEYWYEDALPELTPYEISGPVQDAASWKKLPPLTQTMRAP